jgi:hypothetical protein
VSSCAFFSQFPAHHIFSNPPPLIKITFIKCIYRKKGTEANTYDAIVVDQVFPAANRKRLTEKGLSIDAEL